MLLGVIGVALVFGAVAGYYLRYLRALSQKASIEIDIKEKVLEADSKALKIIEKAEAKAEQIETEAKNNLKIKRI